jgi:hypothetical protein
MRYQELKQNHKNLINAFPMFFAFSNDQFNDALQLKGLNQSEIMSIGSGGFIKKSDSTKFDALLNQMNTEMDENLQNDAFLMDAFLYELANHEYGITYDTDDTLNALGLDAEKLTAHQVKILMSAIKTYLIDFDKHN